MKKLPTLRERWNQLFKSDSTSQQLVPAYDKYIYFTAKSLELNQFVSCNSKGEPMDKPSEIASFGQFEYQEALYKLLFKGGEIIEKEAELVGKVTCLILNGNEIAKKGKENGWQFNPKFKTIESLINAGIELDPTESCISLAGL